MVAVSKYASLISVVSKPHHACKVLWYGQRLLPSVAANSLSHSLSYLVSCIYFQTLALFFSRSYRAMESFENYPLQPPPPGVTSNFSNPENRGPAIVVLCSVFIALMWPIFLLRLYSKLWVIRSFGWDDGKLKAVLA